MAPRNPLIRRKEKSYATPMKNQSAGILDDHAVRKVINSKEGSITKVPVNDIDIANKAYVDSAIAGSGHWTDTSTSTGSNKTLNDLSNFIGADELHFEARNESGSTMNKGDLVYISGFNLGLEQILVSLADANGAGTFPAIGMVESTTIANNANGHIVNTGLITDLVTNAFTEGDSVYMSETPGEFSVRPTATSSQVQAIGIVLRSHPTKGVIAITGAGRTNDIPNDVVMADITDTTATGAELNTLTGGGDTTLHDHDGISENTAARHTQNTDTALGSGAVAADHGTAATDQIINVSYGTGAPPTANTTTIGSLFVQYTA